MHGSAAHLSPPESTAQSLLGPAPVRLAQVHRLTGLHRALPDGEPATQRGSSARPRWSMRWTRARACRPPSSACRACATTAMSRRATTPPCVRVCLVQATFRSTDGIVLVDTERLLCQLRLRHASLPIRSTLHPPRDADRRQVHRRGAPPEVDRFQPPRQSQRKDDGPQQSGFADPSRGEQRNVWIDAVSGAVVRQGLPVRIGRV